MKYGLLMAAWIASSAVLLPSSVHSQDARHAAGVVVAKVNGEAITAMEMEAALSRAARQTFYHGAVNEERLDELRQKVLDELIADRLVLAEAKKRGIGPDESVVEERIAAYEQQYKDSQQWKQMREQVLPELRAKMRENSMRSRLEAQIREVPAPTEAQLAAFYKENIASFTEPQRTRVSVILLKVDPSSPTAVWEAAKSEAERIRARIARGEAFGDLAKMHSGDPSADKGGDMGYLHRGMLAADAEQALEKMKIGDLSQPIQLLQGYALFQLTERQPARVRALQDVRERATELYRRNTGEKLWAKTTEGLRRQATIWLDEPYRPKRAAVRD